MTETNMDKKIEKKDTPQEIDLIELFSRMGNGIGNLFTRFFNLIGLIILWLFNASIASLKFGLKNSFIILLFAALGLGVGKYSVHKTEPHYKTNAIIQTFTIESSNLIEYTNNLRDISESRDSLALAEVLNITPEEAASIMAIEAFWLIDKNQDGVADEIDYENEFEPDSINNWEKINNRFLVQLLIFNPEQVSTIQDKFEAYLNTYPRLEQITAVKRKNLQSEIKRIDSELDILDSLKQYEYFIKDKEKLKQNIGIIPLDKIMLSAATEEEQPTRLLHDITLGLEEQNQRNFATLELETEPFKFISKFVNVNQPVNIEKEYHVSIKYIIYGLLLGIIVSLLLRNMKKVIQFIKE